MLHLRAVLVVARLAGVPEVGELRLDRGRVTARNRGAECLRGALKVRILGSEVLRALPDFGLGAGLADIGARARRKEHGRSRREVGNFLRRLADDPEVRAIRLELA